MAIQEYLIKYKNLKDKAQRAKLYSKAMSELSKYSDRMKLFELASSVLLSELHEKHIAKKPL